MVDHLGRFSNILSHKVVSPRSQSHVTLRCIDIHSRKTIYYVVFYRYCIYRVMIFLNVIKPRTFIRFDTNDEFSLIEICQVREH